MTFIIEDDYIESLGIMFQYLNAMLLGELEVAHDIIDEQGCDLTHSLTGFFMSWVAAHAVLPPDVTIKDWLEKSAMQNAQWSVLSPEERRDYIRAMFEDDDGSQ